MKGKMMASAQWNCISSWSENEIQARQFVIAQWSLHIIHTGSSIFHCFGHRSRQSSLMHHTRDCSKSMELFIFNGWCLQFNINHLNLYINNEDIHDKRRCICSHGSHCSIFIYKPIHFICFDWIHMYVMCMICHRRWLNKFWVIGEAKKSHAKKEVHQLFYSSDHAMNIHPNRTTEWNFTK